MCLLTASYEIEERERETSKHWNKSNNNNKDEDDDDDDETTAKRRSADNTEPTHETRQTRRREYRRRVRPVETEEANEVNKRSVIVSFCQGHTYGSHWFGCTYLQTLTHPSVLLTARAIRTRLCGSKKMSREATDVDDDSPTSMHQQIERC